MPPPLLLNIPMANRRIQYAILSILVISFLVFTIWIIHEANIGRDNIIFKTVRATPYGDKIGHFLLAGSLTIVANFLLRYRFLKIGKIILPYGSLLILAIAIVEEASQHFLPTRSLDIKDALANFAGICVFSLPFVLHHKRKRS